MKKFIILLAFFCSCATPKSISTDKKSITAHIDLVNVQKDQIHVTIVPPSINGDSVIFRFPKTVPGTYSTDNYGRLLSDLTPLNRKGIALDYYKLDSNTWVIKNAQELDKIMYSVNDTFDTEGELGIFSPSGTGFDSQNQSYLLNLHALLGYFEGYQNQPYRIEIQRPKTIIPGTSLNLVKTIEDQSTLTDVFSTERYFEVTDNPVLYAVPDTASFKVDNMEVLIDVFGENGSHSATSIKPVIEKTIRAQKKYLGDIDNTPKYSILLYLSDDQKNDARGSGALEHHTSTVAVFPESMSSEKLNKALTDVISHEFFHILTPLNIHSEEIHNFDYNDPAMSKHLWMYEGVTEYFSQLFQINQGLVEKKDFFKAMADKIATSKQYNDSLSFTHFSRNILDKEYNESFYNVYQKGALIAMTLDLIIREQSGGNKGLLDVMKELSEKYGKNHPFKDNELLTEIEHLTYPEVKEFFDLYLRGNNRIPYQKYFDKVGLLIETPEVTTSFFVKGHIPYVEISPETGYLKIRKHFTLNSFLKQIGLKAGDVITSINGTELNAQNAIPVIKESLSWPVGKAVTLVINRNGEVHTLTGMTSEPKEEEIVIKENSSTDPAKLELQEDWLFN